MHLPIHDIKWGEPFSQPSLSSAHGELSGFSFLFSFIFFCFFDFFPLDLQGFMG